MEIASVNHEWGALIAGMIGEKQADQLIRCSSES
jgi:hypothetical protein